MAASWTRPRSRPSAKISSSTARKPERACDERVLELSARPETYAESILKVCAFCLEPPVPCVSGVSGSDLKQRVLRIMTHRSGIALSALRKCTLCAAAALAIAVPVGFGMLQNSPHPLDVISRVPPIAFGVEIAEE